MATTEYKPGNKFSDRVSIADAAIIWQGLSADMQALVVVEDGMPFLAGVPDLSARADALLDSAQRGLLTGRTHTEDGYPFSADKMQLDRASVERFIAAREPRRAPPITQPEAAAPGEPVESLLVQREVLKRLGISESTLMRRIKAGEIEDAHVVEPRRWRASYIDSLVAGRDNDI